MATEDRLLTIDEAAVILNTTTDHLYRHWKELPFAFKFSQRQLRFSLNGLQRWIASKQEEKQHAGTGV